jgi:hypothetical protein
MATIKVPMTKYCLQFGGKKMATRAYTKGEARADFKKRLGIEPGDRLPVGACVTVFKG